MARATATLRAQADALGLKGVHIEGPRFGSAKDELHRDADIFVLPTRSENFGMVVAEALANATPVICTTGAPWAGLEAAGCGWWIDQGVAPLTAALENAMALGRAALDAMGAAGRAWMERDFSWPEAGARMAAVYRWLAMGQPAPAPAWVKLT